MRKKNLLFIMLSIVAVSAMISCSTGIFAEDIDTDLIIGKWFSGTDENNGTLIELRESGRYYYEVRSFGHKDASASGRWTVKGQSLHLWDLLEQIDDPEGFDQFSFTLSSDSEGRSLMKLRLTMLRTKTYIRIDDVTADAGKAVASSNETEASGHPIALPSIDGVWISSGFTAVISGESVTVITGGNVINARIASRDGNIIRLESDSSELSAFSEIFYSIDGDAITVIPASDASIVLTLKKNQR